MPVYENQIKVLGRVKGCKNNKDALGIVVADLFLGPIMITHIVNIPEDDQDEVMTYFKIGINKKFFERQQQRTNSPDSNSTADSSSNDSENDG